MWYTSSSHVSSAADVPMLSGNRTPRNPVHITVLVRPEEHRDVLTAGPPGLSKNPSFFVSADTKVMSEPRSEPPREAGRLVLAS